MKEKMYLQIAAAIILIVSIAAPHSAGALTTFGKTNPQNQNQNPVPAPTPVGKAKECKIESECAGIQNTTCMADPRDGRTRCLCGDYSAPINGICNNKYKAVHATCNDDAECVDGAECVQRNSTIPGKRCYCKAGYREDNMLCNGCTMLFVSYPLVFLMFLLRNYVSV